MTKLNHASPYGEADPARVQPDPDGIVVLPDNVRSTRRKLPEVKRDRALSQSFGAGMKLKALERAWAKMERRKPPKTPQALTAWERRRAKLQRRLDRARKQAAQFAARINPTTPEPRPTTASQDDEIGERLAPTPSLMSGREIKEMMADIIQDSERIRERIRRVDASIDALPRGQDKRSLRAAQDDLKVQSGLFPDHEPKRPPRADWTPEQLTAKAIEMKDAARKWEAAGRSDKAKKCRQDARSVENEADLRRAKERKRTAGRDTS